MKGARVHLPIEIGYLKDKGNKLWNLKVDKTSYEIGSYLILPNSI